MIESKVPLAMLWQTIEDGVPEPALAFKRFSDVIEIQQEGHSILINPESVPDVCKILRSLQKPPAEKAPR